MRESLDLQADRIEQVLASHQVAAAVIGGVVTARFVEFRLVLDGGARIGQISRLSEEIALALGAQACRIARNAGALVVEIPRADPRAVELLRLCRSLPAVPPCTAVLGVALDGVPLLLRISSADVAHVLIAGTTGSGKTELARSIIASLAMFNRPSEFRLALVDPKVRGFAAFSTLPHLQLPIASNTDEAHALLADLAREMEVRSIEGRCEPRIVVVVDELADLVMLGGKPVELLLTRLTQRGRGAGIHLGACTQKPTAAVIGSLVKSNFPLRLVGSVASPEDAKVASGIARCGAETLLGRGDFLLVGRGKTIRFQAARMAEGDIARHCLSSRPSAPVRGRALELRACRQAAAAG